MKKILKGTILLFIFALVVCTCRTEAIRNIGVAVTLPILGGRKTCTEGIIKDTTSRQYFTTSTSIYTNTSDTALVEVQTYNMNSGKYSDFISVPLGQLVTIPNGYNTTSGVGYKIIARNTKSELKTVTFGGVWNIDK